MRKFFVIILLLASTFSFSQGTWNFYSTSNSPLPENSVRCISFDSQGRKWIGTDYGVAVFDDINWTVYLPFTTGLPGASVRAIVFDSLDNAWIGTLGGGLAKFDGTTWTVYDDSNSPLQDNAIRALDIDSAGALWMGNQDGLAKFDGTNWGIYSSANSIIQNTIASVYATSNQRVFAGSINGGLFILNQDTIKSNFTIANGSGIPDNTQLAFDEDSLGNVWFATPANGIVAWKNVGGWFWYYMGNSLLPSNSLSDLKFSNDESSLWLATADSGIIKKTGVVYKSYTTVNSLMPDNNVQCLAIDNNGVLWIGTATQGVVRFQETTSIDDLNSSMNMSVYPNPSKDKLIIKSSNLIKHYELADVTGKIIEANNSNNYSLNIRMSDLSKGVYFLKISNSQQGSVVKKIFKN
jgi:ligand-binding sensor domain-containing protein